jgi:3-methyladenine DNA glycosylase AlkC
VAEPLKAFFSPELVLRLAGDLARADRAFPLKRFVTDVCDGLDRLELLDRGRHIARALATHLPSRYPDAVAVLLDSLGPEHAGDELIGAGMAPFFSLPHTIFVAEHGLEHFELSMSAQYELTKRFSAEASVRPYIARYPERTLERLRAWARDANPHVRRVVSEGTRLRLPWAPRVAWLERHPEQVLALLEMLKDDAASVVRRSVANNLNDLGKVHPALLVRTCESWLRDAPPGRRGLVEHALRSAVKRGVPDAFRLLGFGRHPAVTVDDPRIVPRRVAIGGRVAVRFTLRSRSRQTQQLLVNLAVHFVKANGRATPKVFKVKRVALPGGRGIAFSTSVSLAVHTTRTPRPGRHAVDVVVNGKPIPIGAFQMVGLRQGRGARRS